MASFKSDPRYTRRVDEALYDSQFSDELSDEADVPEHVCKTRVQWLNTYYDELEDMYSWYLTFGHGVFGASFHQLGTLEEFANFVFKYMQPGAIKSKQ